MQSEAIKPGSRNDHDYAGLVSRFREIVRRAVPPGAIVAVVSRGDHELLDLPGRSAWHFPQRADGVYAGYYPADSFAAIAHLESLREQGAGYFAIPATSRWWMDHYDAFRRHLEQRYRPVVRSDETCVLYALERASGSEANGVQREKQTGTSLQPSEGEARSRIEGLVEESLRDDVAQVFDASHYSREAGVEFCSPATALLHYLEEGHRAGLSPHPLFDARWYLQRHQDVRASGANALIHFLKHSGADDFDPGPYFDTEYYYSQRGNLRDTGVNALVHYLTHARDASVPNPNPLFQQRFYVRQNPDVRLDDATPFEHFLRVGCMERWTASQTHSSIIRDLQRASTRALIRGNWRHGSVLVFGLGQTRDGIPDLVAVANRIQRDAHVNSFVVTFRSPPERASGEGILVLDDYKLACDIFRPAALRLLTKMLVAATRPQWAISEVPDVLDALRAEGVGTYALLPEAEELRSNGRPTRYQHATRMIVPSSDAFYAAAEGGRELPTRVALAARPPARASDAADSNEVERSSRHRWADDYAESLLTLARRDFGFDRGRGDRTDGGSREIRKVIIPCADWSVSGVNAALERVGVELAQRGWDIEILFTRDRDWVIKSVPDESHMPSIPYRYLERDLPGLEGMWAALIADVEQRAPCILFMAYDFFG